MGTPVMVHVVGCGPGAARLVTPEARQAVSEVQVLVGAGRLLDLFPEFTGERVVVERDMASAVERTAALAAVGVPVAVLVSGDPGLCSLARLVVARLGRRHCRIVPGVSSVQVAFARLGLDWTEARLVSAHQGRPDVDEAGLESAPCVAILLGRAQALEWVAGVARRLPGRRLFILEDLSLETERVREVRADDLAGLDVGSRSIAMLVQEVLLDDDR